MGKYVRWCSAFNTFIDPTLSTSLNQLESSRRVSIRLYGLQVTGEEKGAALSDRRIGGGHTANLVAPPPFSPQGLLLQQLLHNLFIFKLIPIIPPLGADPLLSPPFSFLALAAVVSLRRTKRSKTAAGRNLSIASSWLQERSHPKAERPSSSSLSPPPPSLLFSDATNGPRYVSITGAIRREDCLSYRVGLSRSSGSRV